MKMVVYKEGSEDEPILVVHNADFIPTRRDTVDDTVGVSWVVSHRHFNYSARTVTVWVT